MRPNIETHYKDITSHFQKADNIPNHSEPFRMKSRTNPNKSAPIYTNLHQSTQIYTNLHQSAPIYTNLHKSTPICTNLHQSTPICTNLHKSTPICTNLHKSTQSRFKALQALFLADIAHYNYKCSCGLSKGLKMLASMILSPLSKVVLEACGKCVLGYTLLPNCCAENGLHPCTIFQVGKPNSPQSSFSGVATIPKQAWQIDFCVHKSTTCYSQE